MIALRNIGYECRQDTWAEPRKPLLSRVNAVFPDRSHVALLGGASAGKSTLLKIICGSFPPTHGIVTREGSVSFPVGFVGASGYVSVLAYIKFVAQCYCVDPKAFLRFVVEFAEIEDVLHRQTGKLEPDRRSRLNMAIGYGLPFDHYLFDSRIAVSDPDFRKKCIRLFESRQKSAGTILATRKASFARQFCTSAAVIYKGTVVYFEDIDRAIDFYSEIEPNPYPSAKNAHYVPTEALAVDDGAPAETA